MRWAILDAIPPEQARAILTVAHRQSYERGALIFHEGDPGDRLFLLEEGKVAVRVTTPMGNAATLRILVPGDVFGELALISPGRRSATTIALDHVGVRTVHRDEFTKLRALHPGVDQVLIQALTADVRRLSRALLHTMYVPLPQRVAGCLLDLADAYVTGHGPVTVPLTQDDVAGLCGATRQTTNQVLKQFETDGHIELGRGRIVILAQDALRNLTDLVSGS